MLSIRYQPITGQRCTADGATTRRVCAVGLWALVVVALYLNPLWRSVWLAVSSIHLSVLVLPKAPA